MDFVQGINKILSTINHKTTILVHKLKNKDKLLNKKEN